MTRDGHLDASGQATKRPPSGAQYTISHGERRAVVTQVGATLRELYFDGVPALDGFDVEQRASDGRGQVLAPWPNRLTSGRYVFGGQACQAPVNEPSTTSAIHGLVRWLDWTLVELEDSAVTLACVVREQPGYEWQLDLEVAYRLGDDGLTVTTRAFNSGTRDAPFGIGFHPYLTVGRPIDAVELLLPGRSTIASADPDAPPKTVPVGGTLLDFLESRSIGTNQLDTCYGELERGADGRAVAMLSDPATGRRVWLWVGEGFPYLMVYTADRVGDLERRRQSIAIEPMSCPPNALRSGTDVVRLGPAGSWEARWGISFSE